MDTGPRLSRWNAVSWWVASLVVGVGGVWLAILLTSNGPGDSGPVVGNSVMEHLQVGLPLGAGIVLLAVFAGWLVAALAGRSAQRGRERSVTGTDEQ